MAQSESQRPNKRLRGNPLCPILANNVRMVLPENGGQVYMWEPEHYD
jgi:hypothetical protein